MNKENGCLECEINWSEVNGYISGEYPEDGEIFCSNECLSKYEQKA